MRAQLLQCGELAVLVEVTDLRAVLAFQAAVAAQIEKAPARSPWARVLDVVPAARTVLLTVDSPGALAHLWPAVEQLAAGVEATVGAHPDSGHVVTIPVIYDGPDLDEVASLTGLSVADVIAAHTEAPWRVSFGGFAPGFSYLSRADARLEVPRRSEPRTRVPPGAVGLAGAFSGIYPRSSPGGWQLIGRTDEVLWDERRDPPALLRPGWWVRFVQRGAQPEGGAGR